MEDELLAIRRRAPRFGPAPGLAPALQQDFLRTAVTWLPPAAFREVAELGGHPELLAALEERILLRPTSLAAAELGPGGTFPLATASLDLLASAFWLERLPMNLLYMALSELRRTVKPEGYALLLGLCPGRHAGERLVARFYELRGRGTPLELHHFISPEDWELVREGSASCRGRRAQALLLRRLPG